MSTMAQIRTTIELLTNIFKENGCSKVKAEIFRLAKFNSNEATAPLWKLLFELIYFCDYGKIDDVCIRAIAELTKEELVVYVKRRAQHWNYFSHDLNELPNDMSSGSRELLLLLGWIMCKEGLICKFIESRTEALNEDTAYLYKDSTQPQVAAALSNYVQQPGTSYTKLQKLVLLNNKLQLSLKSLFALQAEKNVLRHKIHTATLQTSSSDGHSHLSMLEMYMLQHPELLKQNLELLEKDNERLKNLLLWKENDDVWWQWMDSVLDAKLAEKTTAIQSEMEVNGHETTCSNDDNTNNTQFDCSARLEEIQTKLNETVSCYEKLLGHVEELAHKKQVTAKEIDSIIASIDVDVIIQEAALIATEHFGQLEKLVTEPTFELQKQDTELKRRVPLNVKKREDDLHDIESDLESLRGALSDLQVQMTSEQQQFRQQMEALCGQLDGILCIPPPSLATQT